MRQHIYMGAVVAAIGMSIAGIYGGVAQAATTVYEGELFSVPSGGSIVSDGSASNASALKLTTNATTSKSVSFATQTQQIQITTRATQCKGSPIVSLFVDGAKSASFTVSATAWTTYSISTTVTAGTHILALQFANDYSQKGCNRDVSFDKMTVTSADAPVVTTPNASASWQCGYGSFKVGTWPSSCWRPYADTSVWNTALPASPKLHPNSLNIVAKTVALGQPSQVAGNMTAGNAGTIDDYDKPTYYGQASDPLYTIHCTMAWGTCAVEGAQVRIPTGAKPALGSDGHMTVVDQTTNIEYDFWQASAPSGNGGSLNISWGGKASINGTGLGSDATASRFANLAGVIRVKELEAGVIPHALFMVIKCGATGSDGKAAYVFPATKGDRICSQSIYTDSTRTAKLSDTNAPAMGMHYYLNMTNAEINALPVPVWKKTILRAMAQYGMFFGDTGGSDVAGTGYGFGIQVESSASFTSFGYSDPYVTFAKTNGWSPWNNVYVGNLNTGVDWMSRLKVVDPCVSQKTC